MDEALLFSLGKPLPCHVYDATDLVKRSLCLTQPQNLIFYSHILIKIVHGIFKRIDLMFTGSKFWFSRHV